MLLEIAGQVLSDGSLTFEHDIGVTLLWSLDIDTRADQQAVVAKTTFPSRYTLEVYHPPRAQAYRDLFGATWIEAAVGQPVLFEDTNGNGRWDRHRSHDPERVVGGSYGRAIVWIDALDEPPPPLGGWIPDRPGFHLVDVFREPCIDAGLGDLPMAAAEGATNLEVGYYWQSLLDLDCDGDPDWNPDGTFDDPFAECAEAEGYDERCNEYREVLDDPDLAGQYAERLAADPILATCMELVCPEVVEALYQPADPPPDPDDDPCDPGFIDDFCLEIDRGGADPALGPDLLERLQSDPDLETCARGACESLVDWLYQEPWL